jgi:hypothetical protein
MRHAPSLRSSRRRRNPNPRNPCTVRDLSLTGASLELFDPKSAPAKFTLVIPEDNLVLTCQVIRRTEFRIGIKFD